jgi:hypothetical protein
LAYFFSAASSTFLQAGASVALLDEAGDDPSAARCDALAEFFVVAHAGIALLGSQLLRECGLGSAQQGSDSQHNA